MKVIIRDTQHEASIWAAHYIASKIKAKAAATDRPFVIGLATGSTPIETYAELIRMYKAGEISFKNVISFNMDEYVGLPVEHPESYHSFMDKYLFNHIAIPRTSIFSTETLPTLRKSAQSTRKKSSLPEVSTFSSAESARTATSLSMNPSLLSSPELA